MNINISSGDIVVYTNQYTGHKVERIVIDVIKLMGRDVVVCENGYWYYVDDIIKKEN